MCLAYFCITKAFKNTMCISAIHLHNPSNSVNFNLTMTNSISVANCSICDWLQWNSSPIYHYRCRVRKLSAWYGSWKTPHSASKPAESIEREKLGQLHVGSKTYRYKHLRTHSLSVMVKCNNCIDCSHSTTAIFSFVSSIIHSQNRDSIGRTAYA